MNNGFKTLLRAVALAGLSATLLAQTRLSDTERTQLIGLADRLVVQVNQLSQEGQRGWGPTTRNRAFRTQVADLQAEAVAFRAALQRNRPIDADAEIARLRTSLEKVQEGIHPQRRPDARLRTVAKSTSDVLEEMDRVAGVGKTSARYEAGAYADVDDIDKLATELVEHAARMRQLTERGGRSAPAVAHFEEQARQFQRVAGRRTFAVDYRPHLQRLQSDLNAALREIRRQGGTGSDAAMTEWEWADGLLERMGSVGRAGSSSRAVPDELLGLAHELHVQMMKAEELARASGRTGDNFARLGDQAYAFHHEMHDGRLSYGEAQDRVESAMRTFRSADGEIRRPGVSAELQQQWRQVAATIERMRALMGS